MNVEYNVELITSIQSRGQGARNHSKSGITERRKQRAFFNNGVVNTMTENLSSSPIFAGRYEFQTVRNDWDTGRTKFTHLVFDTQDERLGVIKRADTKSPQAVERLKNEVGALLDLKGSGVPEVYDTGETEYGSKKYFYMVIEFIEGTRVENSLEDLTIVDRSEIITQLFGLLEKAHRIGIVNGDVDLKHLFWRRDQRQLVVIDWGNSKLQVNPKHKAEFAFDLARSAEIIYSLTVPKGNPPATGSLALPKDERLLPGLAPIPYQFYELCKWAPRAPSNNTAPYTTQELYAVSKRWSKAISSRKLYKESRTGFVSWLLGLGLLALLVFVVFFDGLATVQSFLTTPTSNATEVMPSVTSESPIETATLVVTQSPSATSAITETPAVPTPSPASITATLTPATLPSPAPLGEVIQIFDQNISPPDACRTQTTNFATSLKRQEGFIPRGDGNWRFAIEQGRTTEQFIEVDFSRCFDTTQLKSMAVNMWVPRLELQRDFPTIKEPGKEIGFFIEDTSGQRREYTIWIDATKSMHLRVRENGESILDEVVSIVNIGILKIRGDFPRFYSEFPLQIFLERDNSGWDVIYLKQGPIQEAVNAAALDPIQMIRIDNAARPKMEDIQKIGLIGYGGETQTVIWPLVFFGK
jgi:serine/threonine protein kinase